MRAATQKRYQREYREFRIQCSVMYYVLCMFTDSLTQAVCHCRRPGRLTVLRPEITQ